MPWLSNETYAYDTRIGLLFYFLKLTHATRIVIVRAPAGVHVDRKYLLCPTEGTRFRNCLPDYSESIASSRKSTCSGTTFRWSVVECSAERRRRKCSTWNETIWNDWRRTSSPGWSTSPSWTWLATDCRWSIRRRSGLCDNWRRWNWKPTGWEFWP